MASKKKVSAFAIFLIVFAVAMTLFLGMVKNIVPVPMFIVFSLGLLYCVGFAVYMICKNRTFKWFLTEDRSHKKTPAAAKKTPENGTSTAKVASSNTDYEDDEVKVTPSTSKSRKAKPEVRSETKEAKPASKKPQATNKPALAKNPQTTAKKKPVASEKPANTGTTATANTKGTEEKKAKSTSSKPATTGAKPRPKPAEKAGEE